LEYKPAKAPLRAGFPNNSSALEWSRRPVGRRFGDGSLTASACSFADHVTGAAGMGPVEISCSGEPALPGQRAGA